VALIGEPRKNGKTTDIAPIALWGLLQEGEGAEVYSVAGDKDQAKLVFGTAKRMVQLDPELSAVCRVYRDVIEVPGTGSVYRAVSADAPLKEGLSPTLTVVDEVHVIDEDLWNVFALAMGARPEPMLVGITTAGTKSNSRGRPTICYRLYQYGVELATGQKVDPTFYFEWWGAPESLDPRDERTWRIANPGYGDILDPADLRTTIETTHENEFRTKRLNQWTETITAWLPHGAWDAIVDLKRAFDETEPFVAFLDGSWSNDSTGIVSETIDRPPQSVRGHWVPDPDLGHIDMDAVEKRTREVLKMPGCRGMAFDPARFQDLFARLRSEGLTVVEWPTNSLARMVPACQEFYAAVIEKRMTHDGDPRLAAHIANAALKEDRHGPRIVKETKSSLRKIDLAVCAVGAHAEARRLAVVPEPPELRPLVRWSSR
jgi:phage terminase large subunit-like protein